MPFDRIEIGERLDGYPAKSHNFFGESIEELLNTRESAAVLKTKKQHSRLVVLVNNTAVDINEMFPILRLEKALFDPGVNTDALLRGVSFLGKKPDEETTTNLKFAVVQGPMKADEPKSAIVIGETWVKVDVVAESDELAAPIDGDATKLKSGAAGVPILWKETGIGDKWAIVLLGGGGTSIKASIAMATSDIPAATINGSAVTATPGKGEVKLLDWKRDGAGDYITPPVDWEVKQEDDPNFIQQDPPVPVPQVDAVRDSVNGSLTIIRASTADPVILVGNERTVGGEKLFVVGNVMDFEHCPAMTKAQHRLAAMIPICRYRSTLAATKTLNLRVRIAMGLRPAHKLKPMRSGLVPSRGCGGGPPVCVDFLNSSSNGQCPSTPKGILPVSWTLESRPTSTRPQFVNPVPFMPTSRMLIFDADQTLFCSWTLEEKINVPFVDVTIFESLGVTESPPVCGSGVPGIQPAWLAQMAAIIEYTITFNLSVGFFGVGFSVSITPSAAYEILLPANVYPPLGLAACWAEPRTFVTTENFTFHSVAASGLSTASDSITWNGCDATIQRNPDSPNDSGQYLQEWGREVPFCGANASSSGSCLFAVAPFPGVAYSLNGFRLTQVSIGF